MFAHSGNPVFGILNLCCKSHFPGTQEICLICSTRCHVSPLSDKVRTFQLNRIYMYDCIVVKQSLLQVIYIKSSLFQSSSEVKALFSDISVVAAKHCKEISKV